MNSRFLTFFVGLLSTSFLGCEEPADVHKTQLPDVEFTTFVDLRGRVSVAQKGSQVPFPATGSAFAPSSFPDIFAWTPDGLEPLFRIRQRAHAGWSGFAEGQYVQARVAMFRPAPIIDAFEDTEVDPNRISLQRTLRSAIANQPTWGEFFAPPIRGVAVVESKGDEESLGLRGGIQVLAGEDTKVWLKAAEKEMRKPVRLPLFINSNCIVSGATKSAVASCD